MAEWPSVSETPSATAPEDDVGATDFDIPTRSVLAPADAAVPNLADEEHDVRPKRMLGVDARR